MPSRSRARERQEERDFQRYLEFRYQDEGDQAGDDNMDDDDDGDEREKALADIRKPEHVISTILEACVNGPQEARIRNFVTLFEYILTVPDFVKAHVAFCATAVAKAREFSTEPALRDVCKRVVTAFGD